MKKLLILLLFLVSINLVFAADINVKEISVQSVVLPGQNAFFDLEISNMQGNMDEFKVVVNDANWRLKTGGEFFDIGAGRTSTKSLSFFPVGQLPPGVYAVNVKVISTSNPSIFLDKQLIVTLVGYDNAITAKIETNPEGIDPRKDNLVKIDLNSKYDIDFKNINVHVENELFTKDFVLDLNGLESKSEEFIVSLDPNTAEDDYDTKILVTYNDKTLIDRIDKVKVSSYSNVKETKTEEFNFLVKTTTITKLNDGNSLSREVSSLTLSSFEKLFVKFNPEPSNTEKTSEGYQYSWRYNLQPGQENKIIVKVNYRSPLFLLILIILIIYFAYKFLVTDLNMHKKVLTLKSKEGGIAGVKVLLYVKNNGATLKNLHIVDEVPGELEVPHEYMTLKPSSFRKELHKSVIVWEIPELSKGEERLISYRLKSKTGHQGKLTIPRATCRYKNKMDKLSLSRSNEVTIYT